MPCPVAPSRLPCRCRRMSERDGWDLLDGDGPGRTWQCMPALCWPAPIRKPPTLASLRGLVSVARASSPDGCGFGRAGSRSYQRHHGAGRRVGDAAIEHLITLTLQAQSDDATPWSTCAMANRVGLSQTMVSRVWRAFGLQPHRSETFKRSPDPAFVDKVRDVVGLYLCSADRALEDVMNLWPVEPARFSLRQAKAPMWSPARVLA
jgi:hypothetical protein